MPLNKALDYLRIGIGFRRDLVMTVALQGLSMVFMACHILLLSRWLGAEDKGLQALLLTVGQLAAVVLGLGVSASIVSILGPDPRRTSAVIRNQGWVLLFALAVLTAVGWGNQHFRLVPRFIGYELGVSILTLALLSQTSFAAILLALRRTWQYNMASLTASGAPLVALAVAHHLGMLDVPMAIAVQTVGALAALIYSLIVLKRKVADSQEDHQSAALSGQGRIAALGYLSGFLALLLFRGDIFLVGSLGGHMNQVGVYSVAIFVAELALKIPQWSATVLTAVVAADVDRAASRTIQLFWFSVSAALILFFVFWIGRNSLEMMLGRILGPSFQGAWLVTLAVFPRVVFQAGGAIFAANLAGKGYTFWHPGATLGGVVAVFLLDFLLVPRLGAVGGGLSSSLGYLVALIILFFGFLQNNHMDARGFVRDSLAMFAKRRS